MSHTPHPHTTPNPTAHTDRHAGPAGHPTTARPGQADGLDLPAVPLAVWSTPAPPTTPGTEWTVPPLLAQRLIAVYTHPGSTVLTTGASARLVARTATRLDRRPPAHSRRPGPGTVDLLVATPPTDTDTTPLDGGGAEQARWWARLLSPAGVLAVVLPPSRGPAEPAAAVAAAAGAGLGYLQHVIALLWTLHDDHLDPPTTAATTGVGGVVGTEESAFADVLLFTAPGTPDRAGRDDDGPNDEPASATMASAEGVIFGGPGSRSHDTPGCAAADGRPTGSVWLAGQTSHRAQRIGRYTPASVAHPAKMLPALARTAIRAYTQPGDLVLDPMCGIGTTLVEAVYDGRDAVGVEYEPRWAALARDNIDHATDTGAAGHAAVRTGDARHAAAIVGADLVGRVRLLLTSPPYGSATHGQVHAAGAAVGKVRKWDTRYGTDPANLAHRPLPELLDGFADILRACLPLLAPGATVVLTTRPYRHHGRLVDLPGAALHTAASVGLQPVGRYVALLAGIRAGQLVPRASFFQLANIRTRHASGQPLHIPAHEDVIVLASMGARTGSGR
jgi:modification methylase